MIASDMNNPEFQGASNPDARMAVKFYSKPVKNEFKSQAEGRPIFEDVEFVSIFTPGDTLNIIDTYMREDHKRRFPIQWANYQNSKAGGDHKEAGTPIDHWPLVTAAQAEELKAIKFFTVENIAHASDLQLQKLGMMAGMSPFAFRDRARNYLRVANEEASANQADEKVKSLEAKLAEMQVQMAALLETKERGKPGPKPKNEEKEAA